MPIIYIPLQNNPEYRYSTVLQTINDNFSSITTDFLAVTGGTIDGDLFVNGSITATTYYGDGSNLSGVSSANYYTTGATLVGTKAFFNRNDSLSAYTLQLSGLTSGITFSGNYLPLSGGTVTGNTIFTSGLTVNGSGLNVNAQGIVLFDVIPTANQWLDTDASGNIVLATNSHGISIDETNGITIRPTTANLYMGFDDLRFEAVFDNYYFRDNNYGKGIQYVDSGYTFSFVDESLITKRYVDLQLSTGITQSRIQPGLNTYTGGTFALPTVNISAATLASIAVSGSAIFNSGVTINGSGLTVNNDSYFTTSNGQIRINLTGAGNPAINFNYASGVNQGNISAASNNLYIDSNSGNIFLRGTAGIVTTHYNNGQIKINDQTGTANNAQLEINNNSASRIGLFVNGITSQTANLQEWQITGRTLAYISNTGATHAQSLHVSGSSIFDFSGGIDLKIRSVSNQPGIWLNQSAPSTTNFALLGSVNDTFLNASSSASVYFSIGGNQVGNYNSNRFTFINPVSAVTISATTISATTEYSLSSYTSNLFLLSEQIYGVFINSTSPNNTNNFWIRNTDYENFIYDALRNKWLSTSLQRITGVKLGGNTSTQFLRYEDSLPYSTTPFRMPFNATIVKIVMAGSAAETWQAVVTTGTTIGTNNIATLSMVTSTYSAKTDYNINVNSGQTLYLAMSGANINNPRVDVYFKQRE